MKSSFRSRETKPGHAGDNNYHRGRPYLITFPSKSSESQHTADFLAAFPDQVDRFGPLQSRAVDLEGNNKIRFEVLNRIRYFMYSWRVFFGALFGCGSR